MIPHQQHGRGEPLVLVAGLGGKGTSWRPFLSSAAERYRVLTFDNRGSGDAQPLAAPVAIRDFAEDALGLLDFLGLARVRLVGRSMGGMIAQELALLAPERVERLVLVSTTGRADPHLASVFDLWAQMAESGVAAGIRHRNALLWCLGRESLARSADVEAYLRARRGADRPLDYARQARACAEYDSLARLDRIVCPTLVVAGEDDRLTPAPHAEALAGAIRGARLCSIPGAGHLPYLEAPALFTSVVLDFLSGVSPKETTTCPNAWMRS